MTRKPLPKRWRRWHLAAAHACTADIVWWQLQGSPSLATLPTRRSLATTLLSYYQYDFTGKIGNSQYEGGEFVGLVKQPAATVIDETLCASPVQFLVNGEKV